MMLKNWYSLPEGSFVRINSFVMPLWYMMRMLANARQNCLLIWIEYIFLTFFNFFFQRLCVFFGVSNFPYFQIILENALFLRHDTHCRTW